MSATDAHALHARELSIINEQLKKHALLSSIGFIILLLPLGALVARYTRTFTRNWFCAHWIIQFLISDPVIFAGWALGYKSTNGPYLFTGGNWVNPHKKIGLALLILYLVQLALGVVWGNS